MNTNELYAWLLTCTRDFNRQYDELIADRAAFDAFCLKCIERKELPTRAAGHLALYLLGNENNAFSKALA